MFDPNFVKIAAAPINWSNDDCPELGGDISFQQCIDEMSMAGYSGCELGHKFPRNPIELKRALSEKDLHLVGGWFSCYFTENGRERETIQKFKQHIQFYRQLGAKVMVVAECGGSIQQQNCSLYDKQPRLSQRQWLSLIVGLEALSELAQKYDMVLVYHQHLGTYIQDEYDLDQLMNATDPNGLYLLLDSGHMAVAGIDPCEVIRRYGKRIRHVHLKDYRNAIAEKIKTEKLSFLQAVKSGLFTVPGDGCLNFKSIFTELKKQNFTGWMVVEAEQDPKVAPPLKYAKMARQHIQELIGV